MSIKCFGYFGVDPTVQLLLQNLDEIMLTLREFIDMLQRGSTSMTKAMLTLGHRRTN